MRLGHAALLVCTLLVNAACRSSGASPTSHDIDAQTRALATCSPATVTPAVSPPPPSPQAAAVPAEPLQVLKKGFGVDPTGVVGWAVLVENPNTATAVGVQYQVTLADSAGAQLATESDSIPLLAAGARMGIAGYLSPRDTSRRPASVDVQLAPTTFTSSNLPPNFLTTDQVAVRNEASSRTVTGVVHTLAGESLPCVELFAVTYDADGNITGGGLAPVNLSGMSHPATVRVPVVSAPKPARADLFASLSNQTLEKLGH